MTRKNGPISKILGTLLPSMLFHKWTWSSKAAHENRFRISQLYSVPNLQKKTSVPLKPFTSMQNPPRHHMSSRQSNGQRSNFARKKTFEMVDCLKHLNTSGTFTDWCGVEQMFPNCLFTKLFKYWWIEPTIFLGKNINFLFHTRNSLRSGTDWFVHGVPSKEWWWKTLPRTKF